MSIFVNFESKDSVHRTLCIRVLVLPLLYKAELTFTLMKSVPFIGPFEMIHFLISCQ